MPDYRTPGIYIEEVSTGPRPIQAVGTSTAGFVGWSPYREAPVHEAVAVNNWTQFVDRFFPNGTSWTHLAHAVFGFFQNGGRRCYIVNVGESDKNSIAGGGRGSRQGVDVLEEVDEVAIVAAPGYSDAASYDALLAHCEKMKDRVGIFDTDETVKKIEDLVKVKAGAGPGTKESDTKEPDGNKPSKSSTGTGLRPRQSERGFGAFYFPWITVRNPVNPRENINVPPSGHLAGIYARTDAGRGVHKAPANESIRGAINLSYRITDQEQAELNQNGVNCIRFFARDGVLVWGARTLASGSSEWRYLNVRRLFCMVEKSIAQSTRWVVFEPNDRALWKAIVRDVTAFLTLLWRDGALLGATPEEAFFVKCDEETNPPEVIDEGRVVIVIGIAPVKPAEFIIFRIGQHDSGTTVS